MIYYWICLGIVHAAFVVTFVRLVLTQNERDEARRIALREEYLKEWARDKAELYRDLWCAAEPSEPTSLYPLSWEEK